MTIVIGLIIFIVAVVYQWILFIPLQKKILLDSKDLSVAITPFYFNKKHSTVECLLQVNVNKDSLMFNKEKGKLLCNLTVTIYTKGFKQPFQGFVFEGVLLEGKKEAFQIFWIGKKGFRLINRAKFEIDVPKEYDFFNLKFYKGAKKLIAERKDMERKLRQNRMKQEQAGSQALRFYKRLYNGR